MVPPIAAPAYLLTDVTSGQVIVAESADERRDPASLTKLMTATVALDQLSLNDRVTVTPAAVAAEVVAARSGEATRTTSAAISRDRPRSTNTPTRLSRVTPSARRRSTTTAESSGSSPGTSEIATVASKAWMAGSLMSDVTTDVEATRIGALDYLAGSSPTVEAAFHSLALDFHAD